MKALIIGLILATLVISGCVIFGEQQNVTNETNVTPPPPPPTPKTPTLSISSPASGDVIMSENDTADVTLMLTTQNLIVKSPGGASKVGEGHFRITVDDGVPQPVTTKTYLISGLSVGEHRVKVELLNNDRTQYSPAISKEVTFTIEKQKPAEYVPQAYTVSISDTAYTPSSLTVKVGDSVTWTNNGARPQTATCFINGAKVFDTQTLGPGKSATITMNEMLECDYYSQLFRALSGKIKVESNGTEAR
jgi:plastocyanin